MANAQKGEPAFILVRHPEMRIHKDATRWLSELAVNSSVTHQRNIAYALSHWHTYFLARGLDYARATLDDLRTYKSAMETVVSGTTGEPLAPGTVAQRMHAIAGYYAHGERAGWNLTALDLNHALLRASHQASEIEGEKHASAIDKKARKLAPRSESVETDIRPLDVEPLKRLLSALAPSDTEGLQRDRLIAEWLAYVGLRIEEALGNGNSSSYERSKKKRKGLTVYQIQELVADPDHPFDHQAVRVVGKYGKGRNVAVPNWLILKTQVYIQGERARAVKPLSKPTSRLFVSGEGAQLIHRGKPLSIRRYQAIFAKACMRAGLTTLVEKHLSGSDQTRLVHVPKHSAHDLRHTYAVMTYFAEVALGNREPWKPIQAQLGHKSLQTTIDTYLAFVSAHMQWRDLRRSSVRELVGLPNA
ncbi:MAG: tyrosine-type recombinase/integrase [Acidobacteria bacterium]|nr:tyrosine-type recombinase/integrase [Acidobacteriota bacterium]